jgi:hypothetical protein
VKNYLAIITSVGDSTFNWFKQQITYNNKVAKPIVIYYPYGMHANAKPDGKSGVVVVPLNNDPSNRIGFASRFNSRPDLAEGDVAIYLPDTNTILKYVAEDESIEVVTDSTLTVTCPESAINGNVTINGNLTVTGTTALGSSVTSNGKDISDTHTHSGSPTSPVGPVSPTGVPV